MDHQELWQCVLSEIEISVSKANFNTWFRNTSIYDRDGNTIIVSVPSSFTKEWLESKFNKFILKSLRDLNSEIREVKFIVSTNKSKPSQNDHATAKRKKEAPKNTESQLKLNGLNKDSDNNLNQKYTFDTFVVGSSNELAHAAAKSITKNLGIVYNPLFIYGGSGLGKTHLIQSIGNEVLKQTPNARVKYLSAEKFASELVSSIQCGEMEKFKNKYRQIDLLIIDDIQFLSGKEKTQEEFFYTFNSLYEKNKQIIISSDRPPKAIKTLEERLRSRFEGGMIADISYPDFETRLAILKSKIAINNTSLPENVINYIAENFKRNIRELEGALNKVIIQATLLNNTEISLDSIKKTLSPDSDMPKKIISIKQIIKVVSDFYDVEEKLLLQRTRRQEIVKPRQVAMFLLRNEYKASFPTIGSKIGGRDHTTVIHACEKIGNELKNNNMLVEEINLIKQRLYT
ncbi:MAG: chromosomal replication initiator protein DnaA [Patescibacteria group bacterium]